MENAKTTVKSISVVNINLLFYSYIIVGRDISVVIATCYWLAGTGIESPLGATFSVPVQTGCGAHPDSYIMDTGSLSRGYIGRGVALTLQPPCAEVQERVELYLYSPSKSSRQVIGDLYLYLIFYIPLNITYQLMHFYI